MPTLESLIHKNIDVRKSKAIFISLLNKYGIIYGELEIMFTIEKYKETSPSVIAEYLYSERATISRGLKSLEEKSLITYNYDKLDRRKVFVTLSKQGASIINSINIALSKS